MKGPNLKKTTAVGTYPPNAWGFHEMHGNVMEWCSDRHGHDYLRSSAIYPIGPTRFTDEPFRAVRDGGWYYHGRGMRSAFRRRSGAGGLNYDLGFRLSLQTEKKAPATELVKAPPSPVLTAAPVEGESFSIPDINLDMLWCKPGTFQMGSPEDEKGREGKGRKGRDWKRVACILQGPEQRKMIPIRMSTPTWPVKSMSMQWAVRRRWKRSVSFRLT